MMNNDELGRFGEDVVALFLAKRGYSILSIRDIQMKESWKGPRIIDADGMELVSTDWLAIGPKGTKFVEVKTKTRWSWHRLTSTWNTGIDQRYMEHYLAIAMKSDTPVWLLFLHLDDAPSQGDLEGGAPERCPTGLFGGDVKRLAARVHHPSGNWGKGGMVYWTPQDLTLIATREELEPFVVKVRMASL
jgi:hypothetical protein